MLSIFIMYSTDRKQALEYTLACLNDMPLYKESQKTLVVDGKIDIVPEGWNTIQVPRLNGKFCWGRMWDAGVYSAANSKIVYLDSDRLLPKQFLEVVEDQVTNDSFLFTSFHFMMIGDTPLKTCKDLLASSSVNDMLSEPDFIGKFRFDRRFGEPHHGPGKNVMSGSVAFTKKTYVRLGGVDHWYRGHGAFADTDFHMQASIGGCEFVDLGMPEIHYHHNKLSDDKKSLSRKEIEKLSLDNFIYYCQKWKLPIALAESMAIKQGIDKPNKYVAAKLSEIKAGAK